MSEKLPVQIQDPNEETGERGEIGMIKEKDSNDLEDSGSGSEAQNLKLDRHGLPLVPQPTDHKDDPLVSQLES
jgi:hypothetical protein